MATWRRSRGRKSSGPLPEDRGKTRGPIALGTTLDELIGHYGIGRRTADQRVFDAWIACAGTRLAERARPVRFQRGELRIQVDSSSHLHELSNFTGERLRQDANRLLGEPLIKKLAFKLGAR